MQLEARKYLFDIRQACGLLTEFTAGKSLADYAADAMLRSAVERQFEITGEALSKLLQIAPSLAPAITDSKRIISFRNVLIHGYADVSNDAVWAVVQKNLPILLREVAQLLLTDDDPGNAK
jgi:uncharacterized protein with HEPN domain